MAKKTFQERYVEALLKMGYKEVKRTSKYIVFNRGENTYYYLGKSGSLRIGANISTSFPANAIFKYKLLNSVA